MIIHKLVVKCVNTESIKEIFRVQTKIWRREEEKTCAPMGFIELGSSK